MGKRQFYAEQDGKRDGEKEAIVPGKTHRAIHRARSQVDGDRADDANRVQAGERFEARGGKQNDRRQAHGNEERIKRHAMAIQTLELPRHFPVARRHVKQADHCDNRGVRCAQQQQQKYDADDPAENNSKSRAE